MTEPAFVEVPVVPDAEAKPKLSDREKQRLYTENRTARTKFVKRGIRSRLETLQKTFFQLLYELRGALTHIQARDAEQDELLAILAKSVTGAEITEDDLACLQEHVDKHTPKETRPDAGRPDAP